MLRDICLKIGVKLVSHSNKDYFLDNDLSLHAQRQSAPTPSKKKPQGAASSKPFDGYETLPFQPSDFAEIFPVVKHLELQNNDTRALLASAKQAYKDGQFERAFELYSQCINALL